ncbi:MAG: helix-hairpin-helix domain-containing protein [Sarcina sp.]
MTKKERIIGCVVGLVLLISVGVFFTSFRATEVVSEKEVLEMFKDGEEIEKTNNSSTKSVDNKGTENSSAKNIEEKKIIVVEIKGEVKSPNVYSLSEGNRVNELIEKAGGLTQEADIDNINRASLVSDGQCIIIGNINNTDEEKIEMVNSQVTSGGEKGAKTSINEDDVVNINSATLEQLQTLTGIGGGKASAIIEYRESSGGFKTVEDLTKVSGIGDKTLEKIRDRLTV